MPTAAVTYYAETIPNTSVSVLHRVRGHEAPDHARALYTRPADRLGSGAWEIAAAVAATFGAILAAAIIGETTLGVALAGVATVCALGFSERRAIWEHLDSFGFVRSDLEAEELLGELERRSLAWKRSCLLASIAGAATAWLTLF